MGAGTTVAQKGCRYIPHVALLPAGAELTIVNHDGIIHRIRTQSTKNLPIKQIEPEVRRETKEKFLRPETIYVTCDVHKWMSGWLIVHEHPYYAVTDERGVFHLTEVPPGDYTLTFWHETLGEVRRNVSVGANEEVKIDVEFTKR